MKRKICFYDTKPYDKMYFEFVKNNYNFENIYLETKLSKDTAILAKGADAVVVFVNDTIDKEVIEELYSLGIGVVALRCAGYNNVD